MFFASQVCPSIGRHWEVLGFQGGDPRTDLNRSGGLLNVLQHGNKPIGNGLATPESPQYGVEARGMFF